MADYIESALRRIDEIEQILDNRDDPPDDEWMRAIDELRRIGPCSRDAIESCGNLSCSIPAHWDWLADAMDHRFQISAASGSEDYSFAASGSLSLRSLTTKFAAN